MKLRLEVQVKGNLGDLDSCLPHSGLKLELKKKSFVNLVSPLC
jgi:hypothetical protein